MLIVFWMFNKNINFFALEDLFSDTWILEIKIKQTIYKLEFSFRVFFLIALNMFLDGLLLQTIDVLDLFFFIICEYPPPIPLTVISNTFRPLRYISIIFTIKSNKMKIPFLRRRWLMIRLENLATHKPSGWLMHWHYIDPAVEWPPVGRLMYIHYTHPRFTRCWQMQIALFIPLNFSQSTSRTISAIAKVFRDFCPPKLTELFV